MSRVTIALPTKNRPAYFMQCVSSLLAQVFMDWDLIVMDDSDELLEQKDEVQFLVKIAERFGNKIQFVNGENLGIAQAWQRAMEMSETEFCQRLEDDVWLEPDYLQVLHETMEYSSTIAAAAGCNPNVFTCVEKSAAELRPFPNFLYWQGTSLEPCDGQGYLIFMKKPQKVAHLHGLFMYRKSAVKAVGGFGTHMTKTAHRDETDLTLRLFFANYDLMVCPKARVWHAEAKYGGARDKISVKDRHALQMQDEEKFQQRLANWMREHPGKLDPYINKLRSLQRKKLVG